jgi:glycylpeptide N-tetradecanoyltransferase
VYTAGAILPKPVATCRYFHRALNWTKLYETRFSPLPPGSTRERMVKRYKVGGETQLKGMRLMEGRDVKRVTELLKGFLAKFDLAPVYEEEEVEHWFLHKGDDKTRVIWTYVVEVHLPTMSETNFRIHRPRRLRISFRFILFHLLC